MANQLGLVVYLIIFKVLYIPSGAGFLPSTVVSMGIPTYFPVFFFGGGDGLYIYICICYNSHSLRDRNLYSMYVSLSEDVISDVWLPPTKHRTQVLEFG